MGYRFGRTASEQIRRCLHRAANANERSPKGPGTDDAFALSGELSGVVSKEQTAPAERFREATVRDHLTPSAKSMRAVEGTRTRKSIFVIAPIGHPSQEKKVLMGHFLSVSGLALWKCNPICRRGL